MLQLSIVNEGLKPRVALPLLQAFTVCSKWYYTLKHKRLSCCGVLLVVFQLLNASCSNAPREFQMNAFRESTFCRVGRQSFRAVPPFHIESEPYAYHQFLACHPLMIEMRPLPPERLISVAFFIQRIIGVGILLAQERQRGNGAGGVSWYDMQYRRWIAVLSLCTDTRTCAGKHCRQER